MPREVTGRPERTGMAGLATDNAFDGFVAVALGPDDLGDSARGTMASKWAA
jgi:hypothetical protein